MLSLRPGSQSLWVREPVWSPLWRCELDKSLHDLSSRKVCLLLYVETQCAAVRHAALTPSVAGETLTDVAPWNEAAIVLSRSDSHCVVRGWSERILWEVSVLASAPIPSVAAPYAASPRQSLAAAGDLAGVVCSGSLFALDAASGKILYEAEAKQGASFVAVSAAQEDAAGIVAALVDDDAAEVELRAFSARGGPRGRVVAAFGSEGAPALLRPSTLQLVSAGACTAAVLATAAGDSLVSVPRTQACAKEGAADSLPLSTSASALGAAKIAALAAVPLASAGAKSSSPFLAVTFEDGGAAWVSLAGGRVTVVARAAASAGAAGAAAVIDGQPVLLTATVGAKGGLTVAAADATGAAADVGVSGPLPFDSEGVHGASLRALFALPFAKADGGRGMRLLAVAEDGFGAMLQGSTAALWTDDGTAACAAQVRLRGAPPPASGAPLPPPPCLPGGRCGGVSPQQRRCCCGGGSGRAGRRRRGL